MKPCFEHLDSQSNSIVFREHKLQPIKVILNYLYLESSKFVIVFHMFLAKPYSVVELCQGPVFCLWKFFQLANKFHPGLPCYVTFWKYYHANNTETFDIRKLRKNNVAVFVFLRIKKIVGSCIKATKYLLVVKIVK